MGRLGNVEVQWKSECPSTRNQEELDREKIKKRNFYDFPLRKLSNHQALYFSYQSSTRFHKNLHQSDCWLSELSIQSICGTFVARRIHANLIDLGFITSQPLCRALISIKPSSLPRDPTHALTQIHRLIESGSKKK